MKYAFFYALSLFMILSGDVYSQKCLANGRFATACSAQQGSCPTWTSATSNDCGAGWKRSHGTPQMKYFTSTTDKGVRLDGFYAYMWSVNSGGLWGEGMFTPYTFQAHHNYDVQIQFVATPSSNGGNGSVLVYAANGLTEHNYDGCTDNIPSISSKQLIGQYNGINTQLTTVTFSFTADNNYSQIWIYPTASGAIQYNLSLFLIDACPSCAGTIIYNSGAVPSGTTAAGTIYAGSSAGTAGSGTVTIAADQMTTLTASNQIVLQPSFQAIVTTGNFSAQINPCDDTHTITSAPNQLDSATITIPTYPPDTVITGSSVQMGRNGQANGFLRTDETTGMVSAGVRVYPSVSTGTVNITGSIDDLANADITVTDESGRTVFRLHNGGQTNLILDLGNLKNGLYFLQCKGRTKFITQKIIISR